LEKKKKMAKTKEKFELINDILPAIAEKSAHILGRPVPDLAGSITKIMSAVISETTTTWNKETKQTDVLITLFNYTSRVRAYTILATWPEKAGAEMINNETGGRKEATGVWAWKLPSLEPGERTIIGYSLGGLERGDWTETDVFFRGSQDVIGASKMDEKFLEEIRRQERALSEPGDADSTQEEPAEPMGEPTVAPPTGQTTLFGGDV
jgi:DNA topoisomerase-6 subunit B